MENSPSAFGVEEQLPADKFYSASFLGIELGAKPDKPMVEVQALSNAPPSSVAHYVGPYPLASRSQVSRERSKQHRGGAPAKPGVAVQVSRVRKLRPGLREIWPQDAEGGPPPQLGMQRYWRERKAGPWVVVFFHIIAGALGFTLVYPLIIPFELRIVFYSTTAGVAALSLLLLLLVNQVDPGVVPPSYTWDPEVVAAERGLPTSLSCDERGQWVRLPAGAANLRHNWERYCWTCHIWRKPRTTHCNKCGFCMERFDHHCGVVGTCVARKNHRFFVAFLLTAGAGAGLLLAGSVIVLAQKHWDGGYAWKEWNTYTSLALGFLYIYTSLILLFGCMHLALVFCNLTTRQWIGSHNGGAKVHLPTCREIFENLANVCCAPLHWKHRTGLPSNKSFELMMRTPVMLDIVPSKSPLHATLGVEPNRAPLNRTSAPSCGAEAVAIDVK